MASQTRNITLNLPSDLIREAKVYAARHDTSVTALVKDLLQNTITKESRERPKPVILNTETPEDRARAREAGREILRMAREGPGFSGDPRAIKRDDLYRQFEKVFRKSEP